MFRILTNDANASFSLDDLALVADRFYRRSYLHVNPPFLMLIYSYGVYLWVNQIHYVRKGTDYIVAPRSYGCKEFFWIFSKKSIDIRTF